MKKGKLRRVKESFSFLAPSLNLKRKARKLTNIFRIDHLSFTLKTVTQRPENDKMISRLDDA